MSIVTIRSVFQNQVTCYVHCHSYISYSAYKVCIYTILVQFIELQISSEFDVIQQSVLPRDQVASWRLLASVQIVYSYVLITRVLNFRIQL